MDWPTAFFILAVGLSVGSFLNVVIFRLDKKGGILFGRSECRSCGHVIRWYDMVPVVGFLFLGGRCRHCKQKISRIYPVVEILTALSFFAYFHFRGITGIGSFYELALISGLITLIFFDLLDFIIPDKVVAPLAALAFVFNFNAPDLLTKLATALAIGSLFAIIHLGSRGRWMGFGDAKLVFLIGLALGYPLGMLAVLFSVWTAASVGIALVLVKRASMKTALPLGTFLASSSIIFLIFQDELQKTIQTYF